MTTFLCTGKKAYNNELWLEAADHFEKALDLYKHELSDCQLLCEDVLVVNLTQPDMNDQKRALFEEYSLIPDTMEYYQLMATLIKDVSVLVCESVPPSMCSIPLKWSLGCLECFELSFHCMYNV